MPNHIITINLTLLNVLYLWLLPRLQAVHQRTWSDGTELQSLNRRVLFPRPTTWTVWISGITLLNWNVYKDRKVCSFFFLHLFFLVIWALFGWDFLKLWFLWDFFVFFFSCFVLYQFKNKKNNTVISGIIVNSQKF